MFGSVKCWWNVHLHTYYMYIKSSSSTWYILIPNSFHLECGLVFCSKFWWTANNGSLIFTCTGGLAGKLKYNFEYEIQWMVAMWPKWKLLFEPIKQDHHRINSCSNNIGYPFVMMKIILLPFTVQLKPLVCIFLCK